MEQQNQTQQNTNTNPVPVPPKTAGDNRKLILGILSYIGPLVIVSFLMAKDDPFIKFHVKQGLIVFGIGAISWVLGLIAAFSLLGSVMMFIIPVLNIATLILTIFGIVYVIQREEKELPVVGGWAKHIQI